MNAAQFAGSLQLWPGRPVPNIARSRPLGLARLWRGQPAQALPGLLGALFTLCGHAHRLAARQAVAAAQGRPAAASDADRHVLHAHTAREQARRVTLDWAALAQQPAAPALQALQAMPLAADSAALAAWLQREVLAMPAATWLARVRDGGEAWLADWCAHAPTPTARALNAGRTALQGIAFDAVSLRLHDAAALRQQLASDLAGAAGEAFVAAPVTALGCADTAAWSRAAAPRPAGPQGAWLRLAGRLVDLAQLAAPATGARWLDSGACPTGPGEGLAWVETARGLLIHWVRLDGERVAECRVLAPTDWNFHPSGALARALATTRSAAVAEWLVGVFDPCVAHRLVIEQEPAHA